MRIAVVGAGAAGLLFSLLVKRRFPKWDVQTFEQNPEGATYGFGVVFSDGAFAFLERDEPELSRFLEVAMERWPMQRIVHRAELVVGADGTHSLRHNALATQFATSVKVLTNRFAWYGTAQQFDILTRTI